LCKEASSISKYFLSGSFNYLRSEYSVSRHVPANRGEYPVYPGALRPVPSTQYPVCSWGPSPRSGSSISDIFFEK
jgi:hypothetical protein